MNDLRNDAILTKPVDHSWDYENYPESWEFFEAVECENCGHTACIYGEDDCPECGEYMGCTEGPMMNYYYPIPWSDDLDPEVAAIAIAHLPLCIVSLPDWDGYALALTGGGMDLSWEICEAFICLGYYPPAHFAGKLPDMAGRDRAADAVTAGHCAKALQIAIAWMQRDLDRLVSRYSAKSV